MVNGKSKGIKVGKDVETKKGGSGRVYYDVQ
jgi:hypothetical protein